MINSDNLKKTTAFVSKQELWLLDNYLMFCEYYDRTVSMMAGKCIGKGKK